MGAGSNGGDQPFILYPREARVVRIDGCLLELGSDCSHCDTLTWTGDVTVAVRLMGITMKLKQKKIAPELRRSKTRHQFSTWAITGMTPGAGSSPLGRNSRQCFQLQDPGDAAEKCVVRQLPPELLPHCAVCMKFSFGFIHCHSR
jgi:hypothetical protein